MRLLPHPRAPGEPSGAGAGEGEASSSPSCLKTTPAPGRAGRCPGGAPRSDPNPGGTARSRLAPDDFGKGFLVP
ncbi:hypothetical protein NDU88_007846 [Pleurodeles waltl]|uniref:Uncharacterized protein n=1 Tax=Pleurodeles waltl TaxID=8319 RepID=A0AAV7NCK3_PLEWA|nr:hypothetical protein NDU88_007846 [Pleurodeles waltl]